MIDIPSTDKIMETAKLFEELTGNDLKWIKKLNRYVELVTGKLNKE